jgi:hypothetical protein
LTDALKPLTETIVFRASLDDQFPEDRMISLSDFSTVRSWESHLVHNADSIFYFLAISRWMQRSQFRMRFSLHGGFTATFRLALVSNSLAVFLVVEFLGRCLSGL